ncbi:MAG TPA: response regulator [Azospirillaceae bacterium]|nr:response regulator [Azospirillaceae bacterium]
MSEYDFSKVEAFVIDPQLNAQRLLRDVLARIDMKSCQNFERVDDALAALRTALVDLILVDAADTESDAFRLIRTIRHEAGTLNPFACIVVTTWAPTQPLLLKVANSGADDLIVKPVSPKQMQDRALTLIEQRKNFVVTSDFIGPDRRKGARASAAVPVVDVPNSLRLKALGQWDRLDPHEMIARASRQINQHKLSRNTVQMAFLVEFAIPGLIKSPPDRMALDHIGRIPSFFEDLLRRLPEGEGRAKMEAVGGSLTGLIERIRERTGQGADKTELMQMRNLAYGIMRAITPDRPQEAMVKEVADAVAAYRARLDQIAAQKSAPAAG